MVLSAYKCDHWDYLEYLEYIQLNIQLEKVSLREKCPYLELFWSAFSRKRTEYCVSLCIQSEHGKIRTRITPNMDTFYAVFLYDLCAFI